MDVGAKMKEGAKSPLSDAERADYAEHRAKFWRTRCMDHARRIDIQNKEIHALNARMRELEELMADGLAVAAAISWNATEMEVWRKQLKATSDSIKDRDAYGVLPTSDMDKRAGI